MDLLYFTLTLIFISGVRGSPGHLDDNTAAFLFTFSDKDRPIIDCGLIDSTMSVPVPAYPRCGTPVVEKEDTAEEVQVILYRENLSYRETDGVLCTYFKEHYDCEYGFRYTIMERKEPRTPAPGECKRLGQEGNLVGDEFEEEEGQFSVVRGNACDYKKCCWWAHRYITSWNTTIVENVKILSSRDGKKLYFPTGVDGCHPESGYCKLADNKEILWDGKGLNSSCKFEVFKIAPGILTLKDEGSVISIPEEDLIMFLPREEERGISDCSQEAKGLMETSEGYIVSLVIKGTATTINKYRALIGEGVSPEDKSERYAGKTPLDYDHGKMQYGLTVLKNYTTGMLIEIEEKLCKDRQILWQLAWQLRDSAPNTAVRIFLDAQAVVGSISGGGIFYNKCYQIFRWSLIPNGKCSGMWRIEGNVTENNCMDPSSFYLFKCPHICDDDKASFPFYVGYNRSHTLKIQDNKSEIVLNAFWGGYSDYNHDPFKIKGTILYGVREITHPKSLDQSISALGSQFSSLVNSLSLQSYRKVDGSYGFAPGGTIFDSLFGSLGMMGGWVGTAGKIIWAIIAAIIVGIMVKGVIRLLRCIRTKPTHKEKQPQYRGIPMNDMLFDKTMRA